MTAEQYLTESDRTDHDLTAQQDLTADALALVRGGLAALPDALLHELQEGILTERARRDVNHLVSSLRTHLSPTGPDPDVRELIDEHGPATTVLFSAEEWDTGHYLAIEADVEFADGCVENLSFRPLQDLIVGVSTVHGPMGFAAEYLVDLASGASSFFPVGFDDPRVRDVG